MKAVIQRVMNSDVQIDGETVGKIGKGLMVLLGVMDGDTKSDADKLVKKIPNLRIFEDENGKMNLNLEQVGGALLVFRSLPCVRIARTEEDRVLLNLLRPKKPMHFMSILLLSLKVREYQGLKQENSVLI